MSDEILKSEFYYISQTAFQANEDRSKVTNFYLVSVGSLIASVISLNETNKSFLLVFALLFLAISGIGFLTILQLMRLREAWFASALAMNNLKAYAIYSKPELAQAFMWKADKLPPVYKPWSVAFFQVMQIALLGGITLFAAIFYFGQYFDTQFEIAAVAAGFGFFAWQMEYYQRKMKEAQKSVDQQIEEMRAKFSFAEDLSST